MHNFKLKPMGTPGVAPAHVKPWTQQEDEMLTSLYPERTARKMAEQLQRTIRSVKWRLSILRERGLIAIKKKPLSEDSIAVLIKKRHTRTARELAEEVGCSRKTVSTVLNKRGYSLQKCGERHHAAKYSDHLAEQVTVLRDERGMTFAAIAEHINSTQQERLTVNTVQHLYNRRTAADAVLYELLPN
ncbi:DNA-binding protein [Escherichia coli]|uniref:DNA-binding protein n=1 Tax=Escherichia coli TaxID=562 RepID=UPI00202CC8ED|nr:DNA-binding protein [Escherichia coli]